MTAHVDEAGRYVRLCRDNAFHTLATSYIFEKRAEVLKKRLIWVNYVGLAVPLVVGTLVLSFDVGSWNVVIKAIAGAILVPQIAINLFSLVGGWVNDLPYANTSAAANDSLSMRFNSLASAPPESLTALKQAFEKLEIEDKARRDQDTAQNIKGSEKRMGMRYALRNFERPCAGCRLIPTSMKPTDCDVCGNFKHTDR